MKSELDNTWAGSGTQWAFYEVYENDKELYRNHSTHVNLAYDFMSKEQRKSLHGPVKTYHISELEE